MTWKDRLLLIVDIVRDLFKPPNETEERRRYYQGHPHDEPNSWLAQGESMVNPEHYPPEEPKEEPKRGAK